MILFSLEDLTSEKQALAVAERLLDEAIEASTANRSKRQKIRKVENKIKKVQKKCIVKKWQAPLKTLQEGFDMLEESRGELDVNMWGI